MKRSILTILLLCLAIAGVPSLASAAGTCGDYTLDPGEECDIGPTNGSPSQCCESDCTFSTSAKVCREAIGRCDADDHCTGSYPSCLGDNSLGSALGHTTDPTTGHCYLHYADNVKWTDARDNCVDVGGYLAAIDSEFENLVIGNTGSSHGWIGVHDRGEEASDNATSFVRITGGSVDFAPFYGTVPAHTLGNEDCVYKGSYNWFAMDCENLWSYFCELEPSSCGDGIVQPSQGEQCDRGAANEDPSSCCAANCTFQPAATACKAYSDCQASGAVCDGSTDVCPAGGPLVGGADGAAYDARSGHCYLGYETAVTWDAAAQNCKALGGYLAAVEDGVENVLARDTVGASTAWIGVADRRREAVNYGPSFQRITGGALIHNGFANGEPDNGGGVDGNQDCVHVGATNYSWYDANCDDMRDYVCEIGGPALPVCPAVPADCRQSERYAGTFQVRRNPSDPTRNSIKWKWPKGELSPHTDSGDPVEYTSYRLCVYDGTDVLQEDVLIPPGGTCDGKPCWRALGDEQVAGASYSDKSGSVGGITKLELKTGGDGVARLQIQGRGAAMGIPLPLVQSPGPVTVQLFNNATSACWGESFIAPASGSDDRQFKGKSY